jgi:hypothetical protein
LNKQFDDIEWYRDGVKIKPDSKYRIYSTNNTYYLRINDCNPKTDSAIYTVKVKDCESKGNLLVEGNLDIYSIINLKKYSINF